MRILFFLFILFGGMNVVFAQCKTYELTSNEDTINCVDKNDKKQGKWKIHTPGLRGNPATDDEGVFKENLKEGFWRRYDAWGMMIALEQYKFGRKHLKQQYLENGKLEHVEYWISLDPEKKFDTVDVYDLYDPTKIEKKIVPVVPYALEHGTWTFYDTETGAVVKKEEYVLGQLKQPKTTSITKTDIPLSDTATKPKIKPTKEMEVFDKKNKGKKNAIRDGRTGKLFIQPQQFLHLPYLFEKHRC